MLIYQIYIKTLPKVVENNLTIQLLDKFINYRKSKIVYGKPNY